MIPLADASAAAENAVRLWFERATAAQLDWTPAYAEMRRHLLNRGRTRQYAFGVECLKTGRYNTEIPWRFLVVLEEVRRLTGSDWFLGQGRGLCQHSRVFPRRCPPRHGHGFISMRPYLPARGGIFRSARAAWRRSGAGQSSMCSWIIRNSARWPSRIYALTGPLVGIGNGAAECRRGGKRGRHLPPGTGHARSGGAALLPRSPGDGRDRGQVRRRAVEPIQPDADLAGWTASRQWSVDAQGRLVGAWDSKAPCARCCCAMPGSIRTSRNSRDTPKSSTTAGRVSGRFPSRTSRAFGSVFSIPPWREKPAK